MKRIVDFINVWTYRRGCCPVRDVPMYPGPASLKFGRSVGDSKNIWYSDKIKEQFFKYFASDIYDEIEYYPWYKIIGEEEVDQEEINVILFPGDDLRNAYELLDLLVGKPELLQFAKENNILIVICWIFEFMQISREFQSHDGHEKFFKNLDKIIEQLPPENFQFLFNSFDKDHTSVVSPGNRPVHERKYQPYISHVDCFDKISHFPFIQWDPYKDHKYKFSFPVGMIDGRYGRLDLLATLAKRNILFQEDVLFTVNCQYEKLAVKTFNESPPLCLKNDTVDIINEVGPENIFKHSIINDEEGNVDAKLMRISLGRFWYKTPKQFLDSQFQLVVESRIHVPSITEKIYRPLMLGQPFVWFASSHLKPFLESKGYKFFPWIDYSFDAVDDTEKRFDLLMDEVERLYHMDLTDYLIKSDDINIHNIKAFRYNESDCSDMSNFLKINFKEEDWNSYQSYHYLYGL